MNHEQTRFYVDQAPNPLLANSCKADVINRCRHLVALIGDHAAEVPHAGQLNLSADATCGLYWLSLLVQDMLRVAADHDDANSDPVAEFQERADNGRTSLRLARMEATDNLNSLQMSLRNMAETHGCKGDALDEALDTIDRFIVRAQPEQAGGAA